MSCTTGSSRTPWQRISAWARSASSSRSQTQMPCASVGGGVAQRHARSKAAWLAVCSCAGGGSDSMRR
eukprot:5431167-Prymnesium_polylepis.1